MNTNQSTESSHWKGIAGAGLAVGVVYTLSPLLVCFALGMALLWRWASSDLPPGERRVLFAIVAAAVGLRVAILLGLFASTDHSLQPFSSLFGDEEYFIKRSLWMRNVALGIPISSADFIYAYDEYSATSYLYVLALLHTLFGPSPYGVHLVGTLLFLVGALVLFRTVRTSFGVPSAFLGLLCVLFLPSLFAWSISALKEPLFFALMSCVFAVAVRATRRPEWTPRVFAVLFLLAAAWTAETIRRGGIAIVIVGTLGGLSLAFMLRRPRLAAATLLLALVLTPIVVTRGPVRDAVVAGVHQAAQAHWGHINTAGYVYTILDGRFYRDRSSIASMTFREGAQFVVRGVWSYLTVPAPWQIQSRAALSFLPEQIVWLGLVLLAPLGIVVGMRRDVVVSCLLLVHSLVAAGLVALTGGNVGTLVRHRGLAIPFLVWFSVLGACTLLARLAAPRTRPAALTVQ